VEAAAIAVAVGAPKGAAAEVARTVADHTQLVVDRCCVMLALIAKKSISACLISS
jgi:hypothetical protein